MRVASATLLLGALIGACGSSGDTTPTPAPPDTSTFHQVPHSCAYDCPVADCAEIATPYDCPAMASWALLPHEPACGTWGGKYPAVTPGQCTSSLPTGDAAAYSGTTGNVTLLPDGRKLAPAGSDWVFAETDLVGGITSGMMAVPGTSLVLTVDDGPGDHAVRAIDTTKIGSGSSPVLSYVKFAAPSALNSGITFIAPDLVYVATDDGDVQALKLDTALGALTRDDARSIKLPPSSDGNGKPVPWYTSGVAASPDGKRLAVTGVRESKLLVYDVAAGSPTFGQLQGTLDLGVGGETFGVYFDPSDPAGNHAYVSMWEKSLVQEVDLSAAPRVSRTFATKRAPEGIAFFDSRWMVVCSDLGDSLTVVDRAGGQETEVPIDAKESLYGKEPSALAYDAAHKRLYVALSGMNALVALDVDPTMVPPTLTPLGRLPTGFWPSAVATESDGTVVVANLRGRGTGPRPLFFPIQDSDISARMRGSVQKIPFPSASDVATADAVVKDSLAAGSRVGAPRVSCPSGADDFPLPATNTQGPSPTIQHVFFVVRENKGFDGVFGDMPGVNGDASYVLKPGSMDAIWHNLRSAALAFAISDNYYTDAVYSTQGHVWTTYGRTNDYNERTWATAGGGTRDTRPLPGGGVIPVGQPIEGSLFDWLGNNGVPYDIRGEIDGAPATLPASHSPIDISYPGGPFQNIGFNDLEKACYLAGQIRVFCNLGAVTYLTLPNDHTFGISPSHPTPENFCATNDEATGMFLDALSHSAIWSSSLVFITEDDPSQGGEHIDSHRTPLTIVSPWVKRGYVSKTHIDIASIHRMLAHVLGKPYPNAIVAQAPLPFDLFTSTPDYTPFTYTARSWPLACGAGAQKDEVNLTSSWDFTHEDSQPGLDAQVGRWMRGQQMQQMPASMKARIEARLERASWGDP